MRKIQIGLLASAIFLLALSISLPVDDAQISESIPQENPAACYG